MFEHGGLWGVSRRKRQTEEATRRMYKAAGQEERKDEEIRSSGRPFKPTRGRVGTCEYVTRAVAVSELQVHRHLIKIVRCTSPGLTISGCSPTSLSRVP